MCAQNALVLLLHVPWLRWSLSAHNLVSAQVFLPWSQVTLEVALKTEWNTQCVGELHIGFDRQGSWDDLWSCLGCRRVTQRVGNIRSQMQLKVNLQRAVNNPTPMQQVKYPAKRNTVTWWQRRRDVCCQQTGEQTAPCLTALPVHLQAVSAHFIALHSCLGLCAPGCGRRAVRLQ